MGVRLSGTTLGKEELKFVKSLGMLIQHDGAQFGHWGFHYVWTAVKTHHTARLMGVNKEDLTCYGIAGLLHDHGKHGRLFTPLFRKGKGKYTPEERIAQKEHTVAGPLITKYRLGQQLDEKTLEVVKQAQMYHHHDYSNGGDSIPLVARIIRVVDDFHAMVTRKTKQRPRLRVDHALEILNDMSGTKFDPKVVSAFQKVIKDRKRSGAGATPFVRGKVQPTISHKKQMSIN